MALYSYGRHGAVWHGPDRGARVRTATGGADGRRIVMAYIVMAYVVMAYVVMAYVVMAYVVMALCSYGLSSYGPI